MPSILFDMIKFFNKFAGQKCCWDNDRDSGPVFWCSGQQCGQGQGQGGWGWGRCSPSQKEQQEGDLKDHQRAADWWMFGACLLLKFLVELVAFAAAAAAEANQLQYSLFSVFFYSKLCLTSLELIYIWFAVTSLYILLNFMWCNAELTTQTRFLRVFTYCLCLLSRGLKCLIGDGDVTRQAGTSLLLISDPNEHLRIGLLVGFCNRKLNRNGNGNGLGKWK